MPNMINYVDQVKDLNFYDLAPNPVDFLVLSELGYLPYDGVLDPSFNLSKSLRLRDLAQAYFSAKGDKPFSAAACANRIKLLKKVITTKRYKNVKAFAYVDDYDKDAQKQFSALLFRLKSDDFLLAFRGTDDTLMGWKESFLMTYMTEVPAQTEALRYLKLALEKVGGKFHLAGHSKGGSLCLFSASLVSHDLQKRIFSITTYDAPGLHPKFINSAGYQAIEPLICNIIPQDSVVGQLLENPEDTLVVKSNTLGLLQHDTFSWQIRDGHFVRLPDVTKGSRQVHKALTIWLEETSNRELKLSYDRSFDLLFKSGFEYLGDFTRLTPRRMLALLREMRDIPDTDKAMLIRLIRQFFYTYFRIVKEGIPIEDWIKRLQATRKDENG